MKNNLSFSRYLLYLFLFLFLISMACNVSSPTPTATVQAEVDSPLKINLLGEWKISSGGAWGGATLTFDDDGSFSVRDSSREKDGTGNYLFTSENTIVFYLPNYDGSVVIEFESENEMSLTVTTSDGPFGSIYSAERVK